MAATMTASAAGRDDAASSSTEAIDALRREAVGGDPSAQYRLAHLYAVGDTIPRDPAQTLRWMKEAAENGAIDACFELGLIHAAALDREEDVAAAFRWLRYAAASGHARAGQELAILGVRAMETRQGLVYLAEQCGDVAAQFALARAYAAGSIVPPDAAEARRWLTAAAEGGHIDACFELGLSYCVVLDRSGGFAGALHWLQRAADAGHVRAAQELEIVRVRARETSEGLTYLAEQDDAEAQYALAKAHMIGAIVDRDLVRAHGFMKAAAERGHSQACLELGLMYAAMPEGEENLCSALDWVRRAAAAGHPRAAHELQILQRRAMETPAGLIYLAENCKDVSAQLRLANVYAAGEMVPPDPAKAQHWMRSAAERGDVEAAFNLGLMCAAAINVKGNFARAYEWLTRAHEAGHPRAGQELAMLRTRGMETPEGLAFLAERDDALAQLRLAECCGGGNGASRDAAAALRWLQRSAELGEIEAQYRLGIALAVGAGTARDQAAARLWLTRAAEAGHADAPTEIDALGTFGQLSTQRAAFVAKKDAPVLMGTGAFVDRFASILRRHGVPVIDGIATPPDAETSAALFVTDGLHLAPTGQLTCDVAAYEHAVRDAVARFPHARIRHPAAAHDLLGLQYGSSAGLFGLPGSGNTIFMTAVEELQRLAQCSLSRDQEFFRMLSAQHMDFLPAILERNVPALSEWTPLLSNQRPGRADIAWVPKQNGAGLAEHLFGLPCINYAQPCVVSHGIDAAGLKRLDEHGFASFLIIRNPLDTIHSLLNKYKKPLEHVVHDYEAFDLLVQGVVAYLDRIARNEGRRILKYEMLLTQFEAQAANLAEKLRLDCDPAWFGEIKDKLLFKNLVPNDPLHFRGGQSGRWRDALDQRHFEIARGRGLFEVMMELDYPLPLREEFRAQPIDSRVRVVENSLRRDLHFFHHLIDVPLPSAADPAYTAVDETDVALRFEDASARQQLKSALETPFGRAVVDLVT